MSQQPRSQRSETPRPPRTCMLCQDTRNGGDPVAWWQNQNVLICSECRKNVEEMTFCRFQLVRETQRYSVRRYLRFNPREEDSFEVEGTPQPENPFPDDDEINENQIQYAKKTDYQDLCKIVQPHIQEISTRMHQTPHLYPKSYYNVYIRNQQPIAQLVMIRDENYFPNEKCAVCSLKTNALLPQLPNFCCVDCKETILHNDWCSRFGVYRSYEFYFRLNGEIVETTDKFIDPPFNYYICNDFAKKTQLDHFKDCRACRMKRFYEFSFLYPNVRLDLS